MVFNLDFPKFPLSAAKRDKRQEREKGVEFLGLCDHAYLFLSEKYFFLYLFMIPSKVSFQLRSHCNHLKNTSPQDIVKFLSMPYKFLHDLAPAHLSSPYLFFSHPGALLPPPPHTCTYSLELTYYLHQFVHHSHNKKSFFISA